MEPGATSQRSPFPSTGYSSQWYPAQVPASIDALWMPGYRNPSFHSLPPACYTSPGHSHALLQNRSPNTGYFTTNATLLDPLHPTAANRNGAALANKDTCVIISRMKSF